MTTRRGLASLVFTLLALMAAHSDASQALNADSDVDGFSDSLELTLGSNPFAFDRATTLAGQVTLPGQSSAAGAQLTVLGVPATLLSAVADDRGFLSFEMSWPAGVSPVTLRGSLALSGHGVSSGLSAVTPTVPGGVTFVGSFELSDKDAGPAYPGALYPVAIQPRGMAVGDWNQDGLSDLVATSSGVAGGPPTVSVLLHE